MKDRVVAMIRMQIVFLLPLLAGCWTSHGPEVVVYTAQDEEYAKPIFEDFKTATGIEVRAKFDSESAKTVGLANEIDGRGGPATVRCLLEQRNPADPPLGTAGPAGCLPSQGRRTLSGHVSREGRPVAWLRPARARVLLVNTKRLTKQQRPKSILDLTNARFKGRIGMAKPAVRLDGHPRRLPVRHLGRRKGPAILRQAQGQRGQNPLRQQAGGRSGLQRPIDFGITDTDDSYEEVPRQAGRSRSSIPDRAKGRSARSISQNTLAIIKGSPNAKEARKLVDYLLSPEIEGRLALGPGAQVPLNPDVTVESPIESPRKIRAIRSISRRRPRNGTMWRSSFTNDSRCSPLSLREG